MANAVNGIDGVSDSYLKAYNNTKVNSPIAAYTYSMQVGANKQAMGTTIGAEYIPSQGRDEYIRNVDLSSVVLGNNQGTETIASQAADMAQQTAASSGQVTLQSLEAALKGLSEADMAILYDLQQTYKVNAGTIVTTMQQLGFKFDDLSEKQNMEELKEALQTVLVDYVMPPVENIEAATDSINDGLGEKESISREKENENAPEDEDEFSNLVIIGDKTFLETTKIIDGAKTVVRTEVI